MRWSYDSDRDHEDSDSGHDSSEIFSLSENLVSLRLFKKRNGIGKWKKYFSS